MTESSESQSSKNEPQEAGIIAVPEEAKKGDADQPQPGENSGRGQRTRESGTRESGTRESGTRESGTRGSGSRESSGRDTGGRAPISSTDDRDASGDDDSSEERAFASAAIRAPGYWSDQLSKGTVSEQATRDLAEDVRKRAGLAGPKLMMHLAGGITVELERSGGRLQFDWRSGPAIGATSPVATPPDGGSGGAAPTTSETRSVLPDHCSIKISDENLMRIASGDLNPQLAMLSDKIQVDGKHSIAMYFFNLVAPRVRGL